MSAKKVSFVTLENIKECGEWRYKNRPARSNEIFIVVSGNVTIMEDFSRFNLSEAQVFCCKKDSLYQLYNETDGELELYRLCFVGEYGTIPKLFNVCEPKVLFELLELGVQLTEREGYPSQALDAFCELVLAELSFASLSVSVKSNTVASAILGWIEDNKQNNIKVMDAAEYFGLSEGYITRVFREEYSINLKSYIDNIRQRFVCDQLENNETPLSEVAVKCGFENYRQLNTFMNYHVGMSPSEYRKTRKSNNQA